MQNTNAYYRSTYVLVYPKGSGLDGVETIEDPQARRQEDRRRRKHAADRQHGGRKLMRTAKIYPLMVDTRVTPSMAEVMIKDMLAGTIDAAIIVGPDGRLLRQEIRRRSRDRAADQGKAGSRMTYRITMGVRPSDQEWKRTLNQVHQGQPGGDQQDTARLQRAVDRRARQADHAVEPPGSVIERKMRQAMKGRKAILLLVGELSGIRPGRALAGEVAEPAGYRMDEYRAPVPDTLQGATVVTTAEAEALWRSSKAVFFDVMPHTPKPANLPAGTIWRDKVRKDIPGSIWLANVGYGAISEETAGYFREGLVGRRPARTSRARSCSTA